MSDTLSLPPSTVPKHGRWVAGIGQATAPGEGPGDDAHLQHRARGRPERLEALRRTGVPGGTAGKAGFWQEAPENTRNSIEYAGASRSELCKAKNFAV